MQRTCCTKSESGKCQCYWVGGGRSNILPFPQLFKAKSLWFPPFRVSGRYSWCFFALSSWHSCTASKISCFASRLLRQAEAEKKAPMDRENNTGHLCSTNALQVGFTSSPHTVWEFVLTKVKNGSLNFCYYAMHLRLLLVLRSSISSHQIETVMIKIQTVDSHAFQTSKSSIQTNLHRRRSCVNHENSWRFKTHEW